MTDRDISPEEKAYTTMAHIHRGEIIANTILFERNMDEFIASYFSDTQDRKLDLIEMIISCGLTYKAKADLISRLLKKLFPDDKIRKERFRGFNRMLRDIADDRNKFAHDILYIDFKKPEDFKKYAICLINFQDLTTLVTFSNDDITKILERIGSALDILEELRKELWGQ